MFVCLLVFFCLFCVFLSAKIYMFFFPRLFSFVCVSVSTTTFTGFLYVLTSISIMLLQQQMRFFFFSKMKRRYFSQALPYYLFLIWNKTFIQMKIYAFLDNVAIQSFYFILIQKKCWCLKKNIGCAIIKLFTTVVDVSHLLLENELNWYQFVYFFLMATK